MKLIKETISNIIFGIKYNRYSAMEIILNIIFLLLLILVIYLCFECVYYIVLYCKGVPVNLDCDYHPVVIPSNLSLPTVMMSSY